MAAWLLNLVYLFLVFAVSPVLVYRRVVYKKYRSGLRQKLWGAVPWRSAVRRAVWLHAVSVGEVLQLEPVLKQLGVRFPDCDFVISVTTETGYDVARQRYPQHRIIFFPLDFTWAVDAALARIQPAAIVLVELELWPNFIRAASRRGIPIVLINGRVSERSFRGYSAIRPLIAPMLKRLAACGVQNGTYASRLVQLGADARHVTITGSIKFDRVETDRQNRATCELRTSFGLGTHETILIAGSTQPPEETYALQTYLALREKYPNLRLILVPRHRERFEEVACLVRQQFGLPLLRRTEVLPSAEADRRACPATSGTAEPSVLLLDTLGELSACWGLANLAFVGGSLTPRGGQNMIEPAGYGAAVMFGPNTQNFKDTVELLLGEQAAVVVRNPAELTAQVQRFLDNPALADGYGARAQELVQGQRGATSQTIELIAATLEDRRPVGRVGQAA